MKEITYQKKEMNKSTFITLFLERLLRALDNSIRNISLIDTADMKQLLLIEKDEGKRIIDITKLSNIEITKEAIKAIEG